MLFPIFLDLRDKRCLVVGGGEIAARKTNRLLACNAHVTVVAPALGATLSTLAREHRLTHLGREFVEGDLEGQHLVIAATADTNVNLDVSRLAQARGIPVNVVDNPAHCTFLMPSVIDRAPVQIAISTGGASPVLARLLRAQFETLIPAAFGRLATLMSDFRGRVKARFPDSSARRRFWEQVLEGPVAEMLFAGQDRPALAALQRYLETGDFQPASGGEVYLVGGGPGDPDLLTFRALRLMQRADVVVYDRLVSPEIVDLTRRDAERIYVGKQPDQHTVSQGEINDLLVRLATAGKRVLRLKGGDPFIFGRGGEEIESLSSHGIPFQIVPGITAASGCACYAGIPLTHRDYADACVFVTGHVKDGRVDLNWQTAIQPRQTLVVYMGVAGLDTLCRELVSRGMDGRTPAALVQQGTTPRQRVFSATVATLPGVIADKAVAPPSMLIIGEVVKLQDKLAWFEPAEAQADSE
jgi:uroporphyrin-III C-methyltransferase/precorrin-2 dehydrogenase/sirohydrochlorin ferrochelatase